MCRPKNAIDKKHIEQLTNLTNQTFGKPLTHSFESELLSKEIKRQTGTYLSPQTLRRFFGFLKTEFSPSIKTLNALAVYNGFPNWHAFTEQSSSNYQPLTLDQEASLYLDFYKIEMKAEADMNYHNASRNIALRILFNPTLLSKLSSALAKNPVSQTYFFERFPFIDGLCTDYKRSIQLYLQKKDDTAQIFGNSLLFLSAFLGNRHKELRAYLDRINKVTLHKSMHPFIVARLFGSNILYQQLVGENVSSWIEMANKWNQYFLQKSVGFWHYPYFQHMICDYLNLVGLFRESYQIARTISFSNNKYEIEKGYPEAIEVINQIAKHSGSKEGEYADWLESTKVFESIHPLFKKYYRMQTLSICSCIATNKKKKDKITAELKDLILQTGFAFFKKYLD
jgi:hypothetical protein